MQQDRSRDLPTELPDIPDPAANACSVAADFLSRTGPGESQTTAEANWVGKAVGTARRYEIQSILGQGGMAVVYLATDNLRADHRVAVKVPRQGLLNSNGFIERFEQEFAVLVRLEHPHICRVLDTGVEGGVPFLVLPYLGGGSLRSRYMQDAHRQEDRLGTLRSWLDPIAAAVDFIHSRQYLHRDIKPDNILFDEAGQAFLGDFGIVQAMRENQQDAVQELSAAQLGWLGTPGYIAPEAIAGLPQDGRADLYALAAVVYAFLTDRSPFPGDNAESIRAAQLANQPRPPQELNPAIPLAASQIILQALQANPGDRPATCGEFAELLRNAFTPEVAPRVATTAVRFHRPPRWAWWGIGIAASAAITVAAPSLKSWLTRGAIHLAVAKSDESAQEQTEQGQPTQRVDGSQQATADPTVGQTEVNRPRQNRSSTSPSRPIARPESGSPPSTTTQPSDSQRAEARQQFENGKVFLADGEPDDAELAFTSAIRLVNNEAEYHAGLADACQHQHKLSEALRHFDRAIELQPIAEYYARRGLVHLAAQSPEQAVVDFDRAIQLDPNHSRYYAFRGLANSRLGRHEAAVQDYRRALQPSNDTVLVVPKNSHLARR